MQWTPAKTVRYARNATMTRGYNNAGHRHKTRMICSKILLNILVLMKLLVMCMAGCDSDSERGMIGLYFIFQWFAWRKERRSYQASLFRTVITGIVEKRQQCYLAKKSHSPGLVNVTSDVGRERRSRISWEWNKNAELKIFLKKKINLL